MARHLLACNVVNLCYIWEMRNKLGQFIKGNKPSKNIIEAARKTGILNKGKKRSKKFKENISRLNKGRLSGSKHHQWKGGRYTNKDGYVFIYSPDHPNKTKMGYVLEHRLVMEKKIGRYLLKTEVVHHMNHKPSDNRIENLMLIENNGLHTSLELRGRKRYGLRKRFIERE